MWPMKKRRFLIYDMAYLLTDIYKDTGIKVKSNWMIFKSMVMLQN